MGYYKILSKPMSPLAPKSYKGLYRSEPFPPSNSDKRFIELWSRYTQYLEPLNYMGITTELAIDELKELSALAAYYTGDDYELIYFDDVFQSPCEVVYYGIDVSTYGGYSMLGEGLFNNRPTPKNNKYNLMYTINQYFIEKLNSNWLFDKIEDSVLFREVLNELISLFPEEIESDKWYNIYIFRVLL